MPTREKLNSDLQVSDHVATTIDYGHTMHHVHVIVDAVQIH